MSTDNSELVPVPPHPQEELLRKMAEGFESQLEPLTKRPAVMLCRWQGHEWVAPLPSVKGDSGMLEVRIPTVGVTYRPLSLGNPAHREALEKTALELDRALASHDIVEMFLSLTGGVTQEPIVPIVRTGPMVFRMDHYSPFETIELKRRFAKGVNAICRKYGLAISHPETGDPCALLVIVDRSHGRFALENQITKKRSHSTRDPFVLTLTNLTRIAIERE